MLIASRAQVGSQATGAGYVEGWFPEDLAAYVDRRDPDGRVVLCRDHGGPWQHATEAESKLTEAEAMSNSLASFQQDIDGGMSVLHIDVSRDQIGPATPETALRRLVRLYGECHEYARQTGRSVHFEIGFEEQSETIGDHEEFRWLAADALDRLRAASLPQPMFIVAQTGTKVVETENRGALLADPIRAGGVIREFSRVCRWLGSKLKAHNVDYLPDDAVRTLLDSGVDAVNVAPEFGVAETRALLRLLSMLGLRRERDAFLDLAYNSGAWRKWVSADSEADDLQRCLMAGHYVFASDDFKQTKMAVDRQIRPLGLDIDEHLRRAVESSMERYVRHVRTWRECETVAQG